LVSMMTSLKSLKVKMAENVIVILTLKKMDTELQPIRG